MRSGFALALAAVLLLGLIATSAPADKKRAAGEVYIALGDSYTSGPLVPMQHGDPLDCGRSDQNYPSLVAEALKPETFIDVSCGSAKTKHMTEPQTDLPAGGTNPPQFNALRPDATLVTVGIGGNDAGLVGVATECAQLGVTPHRNRLSRSLCARRGRQRRGQDRGRATEDRRCPAGDPRGQPHARVAIVGYPDVLPRDGTNCYPTVPLSVDDVKYIDGLIVRINKMIEEEAAKNDAEFIDTYDDSIGHDACKLPPARWYEGLAPTEPAYPLHPNAKGLASMGKSAIAVLSKPAPSEAVRISGLRTRSHHSGSNRKIAVRFHLDQAARLTITRARLAGKDQVGESRPVAMVDGVAGRNVVRVRVNRLGRAAGRYRLMARAEDGRGLAVLSKYRVRRRR